jgi:two-component system, OmpR family, response regulator
MNLSADSGPAGGRQPGPQGPARPLRVLLVEDSKILAQRLLELLSQGGQVEVVAVVDTEADALEAIQAHSPDAVILDLRLRQGSGFGALERMNALARRPVVVVMTNYALPQYRRRATQLGAEYFLDKMRDFETLQDVLRAIRESRRN